MQVNMYVKCQLGQQLHSFQITCIKNLLVLLVVDRVVQIAFLVFQSFNFASHKLKLWYTVDTFSTVMSSWWADLLVLKCPLNLQKHSLPCSLLLLTHPCFVLFRVLFRSIFFILLFSACCVLIFKACSLLVACIDFCIFIYLDNLCLLQLLDS